VIGPSQTPPPSMLLWSQCARRQARVEVGPGCTEVRQAYELPLVTPSKPVSMPWMVAAYGAVSFHAGSVQQVSWYAAQNSAAGGFTTQTLPPAGLGWAQNAALSQARRWRLQRPGDTVSRGMLPVGHEVFVVKHRATELRKIRR